MLYWCVVLRCVVCLVCCGVVECCVWCCGVALVWWFCVVLWCFIWCGVVVVCVVVLRWLRFDCCVVRCVVVLVLVCVGV